MLPPFIFLARWLHRRLLLIVSIGTQNLYVLRQAVQGRHVGVCVAGRTRVLGVVGSLERGRRVDPENTSHHFADVAVAVGHVAGEREGIARLQDESFIS